MSIIFHKFHKGINLCSECCDFFYFITSVYSFFYHYINSYSFIPIVVLTFLSNISVILLNIDCPDTPKKNADIVVIGYIFIKSSFSQTKQNPVTIFNIKAIIFILINIDHLNFVLLKIKWSIFIKMNIIAFILNI